MQIVEGVLVIRRRSGVSLVTKLSREEKAKIKQANIKKLIDEYNGLYRQSKKYDVVPDEIIKRCKEIAFELKCLKVFRPRR